MSAHAHNLQLQGQNPKDVDEIGQGRPEKAALTEREQALLDYVKVLTLEPAKVQDSLVERMRRTGWTDEQIFEASFITALFAFYNRMADAYGLDYNSRRWLPPGLRSPAPKAGKPPASPAPGGKPDRP